jgi:hypothetical protein
MFAQKKFQLRLVTHFATILIQKSTFFNTLKMPFFQCDVFFRIYETLLVFIDYSYDFYQEKILS